jgi:hypothetical protein
MQFQLEAMDAGIALRSIPAYGVSPRRGFNDARLARMICHAPPGVVICDSCHRDLCGDFMTFSL